MFKTNLDKWSKDMHCVVQFMNKIQQQDDEKRRAQVCIDILFNMKKTEHYGSFSRCEHGTKMNFENMTNYAIPLVILTWHRMIQEYFWKNGEKTFFEYGQYMPRKSRFPKDGIELYLINGSGKETQIKSFDMIRPNADADVSQDACLSLFEWANYLLEPNAGLDKIDNDNDLKRPMMSYKITDDEINWKHEPNTDTTVTNATASVSVEYKLWSRYDWSVESKTGAALRYNISNALKQSHSKYSKLKRLNEAQQEEKDVIELGMLSIMQMHYNETGTEVAKNTEVARNWKQTFNNITTVYHDELNNFDSEMIETQQERIDATDGIANDDDDDDNSDDDESFDYTSTQRKGNSLFDDEESSDDPDTQNTLGKESGHEKIAEIDTQDAAATDKDTTESGKATNNDVSDKSDHESATTNKPDAAGNNKRTADNNSQVNRAKRIKKR